MDITVIDKQIYRRMQIERGGEYERKEESRHNAKLM